MTRTDQGSKAEASSFHLKYWLPQTYSFGGSAYLVSGPYIFCRSKYFLLSASRDRDGLSGILKQSFFIFRANEGVLENLRPQESIPSSGAGPAGHLGRLQGHFRPSFDQRR